MRFQKTMAITALTLLLVAGLAFQLAPETHIVINDQEFGGLLGFSVLAGGLGISVFAVLFALACAGLLIAGTSALMVVVAGIVIASVALSLLPLALPFLLLAGIIYLFIRPLRKTA